MTSKTNQRLIQIVTELNNDDNIEQYCTYLTKKQLDSSIEKLIEEYISLTHNIYNDVNNIIYYVLRPVGLAPYVILESTIRCKYLVINPITSERVYVKYIEADILNKLKMLHRSSMSNYVTKTNTVIEKYISTVCKLNTSYNVISNTNSRLSSYTHSLDNPETLVEENDNNNFMSCSDKTFYYDLNTNTLYINIPTRANLEYVTNLLSDTSVVNAIYKSIYNLRIKNCLNPPSSTDEPDYKAETSRLNDEIFALTERLKLSNHRYSELINLHALELADAKTREKIYYNANVEAQKQLNTVRTYFNAKKAVEDIFDTSLPKLPSHSDSHTYNNLKAPQFTSYINPDTYDYNKELLKVLEKNDMWGRESIYIKGLIEMVNKNTKLKRELGNSSIIDRIAKSAVNGVPFYNVHNVKVGNVIYTDKKNSVTSVSVYYEDPVLFYNYLLEV